MNAIEDSLLEKGFHESVLKQMNELKQNAKMIFKSGQSSYDGKQKHKRSSSFVEDEEYFIQSKYQSNDLRQNVHPYAA